MKESKNEWGEPRRKRRASGRLILQASHSRLIVVLLLPQFMSFTDCSPPPLSRFMSMQFSPTSHQRLIVPFIQSQHLISSFSHSVDSGSASGSDLDSDSAFALQMQTHADEVKQLVHGASSDDAVFEVDDVDMDDDPLQEPSNTFSTFDWSATNNMRLLTGNEPPGAHNVALYAPPFMTSPVQAPVDAHGATSSHTLQSNGRSDIDASRNRHWSAEPASTPSQNAVAQQSLLRRALFAASSSSSASRLALITHVSWHRRLWLYVWHHPFWMHRLTQLSLQWSILLASGAMIGLLASAIDITVHWAIDVRSGRCLSSLWRSRTNCNDDQWQDWAHDPGAAGAANGFTAYIGQYLVYCCLSVLMATCSAWLVRVYAARWASGSGIAEIKTILGGVRNDSVLSGRTLLIKCTALILSVSSGLSVGKEGPAIHIAACVGHQLSRLLRIFRIDARLHSELLSAACAAGVAAAFGAPIGGVLYSLEELSTYFPQQTMLRCFVCAIAATLTLQFVDPYQLGRLTQFPVIYTSSLGWSYIELFPFALVGVCGGAAGAAFIRVSSWLQRFRRLSVLHSRPVLECAACAALSALLKFPSRLTRGNFTEVLETLFSDCTRNANEPTIHTSGVDLCSREHTGETVALLLYVSILTWLLSVYSIQLRVPSGLLIPSLISGSAFGRAS